MVAGLFHEDGQTHGWTDTQRSMTKLIVVFRNFANATTKAISISAEPP
jgi:hypothetical protein